MKNIIFLIVMAPALSFGQIKRNEKDKFTGKHILETEFVRIHSDKLGGMTDGGRLTKTLLLNFSKLDEFEFLRIKWATNKPLLSIPKNSEVIFLDADGHTYKFKTPSGIYARRGDGTVGSFGALSYGLDIFLIGDIPSIRDKPLTELRIYTDEGFFDFKLIKNSHKAISKQLNVFYDAIEGRVIKKAPSARYDDY
ncbi:hypothetical protein [Leadbetterella byssophila]|uniref:hypothetical protein n=1 Tax=Leadbetterella byssophila TaxID=316068 RepID=UPI0039A38E49